jgi:hypothetical protein
MQFAAYQPPSGENFSSSLRGSVALSRRRLYLPGFVRYAMMK